VTVIAASLVCRDSGIAAQKVAETSVSPVAKERM
jgi:hypothetical protein